MLEMIDVSKIYPGGSVALQDINVRIEQGEFVFIVGPSGAGKSTFFKMLFREVLPSSGKVIVNGHDLVKMTDKEIPYFRRQLGIVFQDYRLLPDRTVYDNVAFAMQVIETPYRNTALLDALLETLAPDTRLTVAIDVTGQNESIRTLTAAAWKAIPKAMRTLPKLPTVFAFLAKPGKTAPRYAPECAGGKRAHTAPSSKPAVLNNRPKQAYKTHRPEGSPVKTPKGGR